MAEIKFFSKHKFFFTLFVFAIISSVIQSKNFVIGLKVMSEPSVFNLI